MFLLLTRDHYWLGNIMTERVTCCPFTPQLCVPGSSHYGPELGVDAADADTD